MSNITLIKSNNIGNFAEWLESNPTPTLRQEQFAAKYNYLSFVFSLNPDKTLKVFYVSTFEKPPSSWFCTVDKYDATPTAYARQKLLRELKSGKVIDFLLYENEDELLALLPQTPTC